ncbi:50S ribosome-binding GTPase domain protein [Leptospira weilii str. Ecochallenge]|uniref:50S ribosome-binding GTPase domain protein n=1 Tax=Leptospira weilii str. Ecochallenge TaxID=1049986 RepID=N1U1U2_9LEPT|nr:50S ribosome-binding GTPase domain protein [Leptospira weilii str. Ecochallenge]
MNEDPQKKDEPFFKDVEFKASYGEANQIPSQGIPQIAFAGRSNAGKSSLLNAILERKSLAKVSSTPGKTKLLNFFLLIVLSIWWIYRVSVIPQIPIKTTKR